MDLSETLVQMLEVWRDGSYPKDHLNGQQAACCLENDGEAPEATLIPQIAAVHS